MTQLTVVSTSLELPQGSRFTYRSRFPIEAGALCLLTINGILTIGRYFQDVAGCDWIIQPGLFIQVIGKTIVEIWGVIAPLVS